MASYLPLHMVTYPLSMCEALASLSQFSSVAQLCPTLVFKAALIQNTFALNFPSSSPIQAAFEEFKLFAVSYPSYLFFPPVSPKLTGLLPCLLSLYMCVCVYVCVLLLFIYFWLLLLGLFSSCDMTASQCSVFSCGRAQAQ